MKIMQYSIVVVNLDPTIGNEIKKTMALRRHLTK